VTQLEAATALTEALAALVMAEQAINAALATLAVGSPETPTRRRVATRTTGTQIMSVLATAREPLALIDIADAVVALRRGEDEPRKGGGTRYQEMCRTALARLIDRGLVERVEPADKRGLMRFQRREKAEA
jgi:hypothetical protein